MWTHHQSLIGEGTIQGLLIISGVFIDEDTLKFGVQVGDCVAVGSQGDQGVRKFEANVKVRGVRETGSVEEVGRRGWGQVG